MDCRTPSPSAITPSPSEIEDKITPSGYRGIGVILASLSYGLPYTEGKAKERQKKASYLRFPVTFGCAFAVEKRS